MREYAFMMVDYPECDFIKELKEKIDKEDIYYGKDGEYGVEDCPHVTLVACLDNDTDLDKLKELLLPLEEYTCMLTNVSVFENDEYDVLKCDVGSVTLYQSNDDIRKVMPSHSEHQEYHPHMTVAYLKRGCAEKYIQDELHKLVILAPKNFHYSWVEDGKEKEITFEK